MILIDKAENIKSVATKESFTFTDDIKKKLRAAFSIHICSDSGQTDFCIKVDGKDHT